MLTRPLTLRPEARPALRPPTCAHLLQRRQGNVLGEGPCRAVPEGQGRFCPLGVPCALPAPRSRHLVVLEAQARVRWAAGRAGVSYINARWPRHAGGGGTGGQGLPLCLRSHPSCLTCWDLSFIYRGRGHGPPAPRRLLLQIRAFLAFSGERREAGRRGGVWTAGAKGPPPAGSRGDPSPSDRGSQATAVNGPDAAPAPALGSLWQRPLCGARTRPCLLGWGTHCPAWQGAPRRGALTGRGSVPSGLQGGLVSGRCPVLGLRVSTC